MMQKLPGRKMMQKLTEEKIKSKDMTKNLQRNKKNKIN